jgi:2-haloacid dehalogenase
MSMNRAIAFDIYGTLIDTDGVLTVLSEQVGEKAPAIGVLWRQKQLEYSFRRGLMQYYQDFSICTRDALLFACQTHDVKLDAAAQQRVLGSYAELPAFADVAAGLGELVDAGVPLYAFSNGSRAAVTGLLQRAGLSDLFKQVISVEDVQSFKPDPKVYAHLAQQCGLEAKQIWLVSSNPFDVLGAAHSGLRTAWLQRDPAVVFDPWGIEPNVTLHSLLGLADRLPQERR